MRVIYNQNLLRAINTQHKKNFFKSNMSNVYTLNKKLLK